MYERDEIKRQRDRDDCDRGKRNTDRLKNKQTEIPGKTDTEVEKKEMRSSREKERKRLKREGVREIDAN